MSQTDAGHEHDPGSQQDATSDTHHAQGQATEDDDQPDVLPGAQEADTQIDASAPPWALSAPLTLRDHLALALDGRVPTGDRDAYQAYQLAGRILAPHLRDLQHALGLSGSSLFAVGAGRFDRLDRALVSSGFLPSQGSDVARSTRGSASYAPVLLVGSASSESTDVLLREHLQRGGLVVTSDRSAELPLFAALGVRTQASPVAHIRARRDSEVTLAFAAGAGQDRLLPALRLSAGHRALTNTGHADDVERVLLRDAETAAPLVVLWHTGGGYLLHSVAHWWQNETPDRTALGRLPLREFAGFRSLTDSNAQWGEFHAGYNLLTCLLYAMRVALLPDARYSRLQEAA